jgi:hypothetical protein
MRRRRPDQPARVRLQLFGSRRTYTVGTEKISSTTRSGARIHADAVPYRADITVKYTSTFL